MLIGVMVGSTFGVSFDGRLTSTLKLEENSPKVRQLSREHGKVPRLTLNETSETSSSFEETEKLPEELSEELTEMVSLKD
jgi:hypothetical protein